MAIPGFAISNFNALKHAFEEDKAEILECRDKETGEKVYAIGTTKFVDAIVSGVLIEEYQTTYYAVLTPHLYNKLEQIK